MSCALPGCGGLLCSLRSVFPQSSSPNVSRCLCARQRSWAPCWQHSRLHLSMLMTFTIWRSSSVHWHDAFLGRNAYVFEGGRIVKKLGAAVTRPSSRSLPSSCDLAPAKTAEVASEATHLGAVHGTSSKDRWDIITYCASPPSDHCGRLFGCWATNDFADLECGFDTRPIVHAK